MKLRTWLRVALIWFATSVDSVTLGGRIDQASVDAFVSDSIRSTLATFAQDLHLPSHFGTDSEPVPLDLEKMEAIKVWLLNLLFSNGIRLKRNHTPPDDKDLFTQIMTSHIAFPCPREEVNVNRNHVKFDFITDKTEPVLAFQPKRTLYWLYKILIRLPMKAERGEGSGGGGGRARSHQYVLAFYNEPVNRTIQKVIEENPGLKRRKLGLLVKKELRLKYLGRNQEIRFLAPPEEREEEEEEEEERSQDPHHSFDELDHFADFDRDIAPFF
ncbi:hypothetical protein IE53DRAFT_386268 [Violaceomyces palustris]|uniref:Uncharacterized protein n=1 Tax=Violaceomyces palustris TaxID=1673888 RepID=A0ACD0NZP9_9BASI|nr:hypothetical protein IE53DRAFT_386268 [Violaceomyces palustris]